jgi:hypothetical protein
VPKTAQAVKKVWQARHPLKKVLKSQLWQNCQNWESYGKINEFSAFGNFAKGGKLRITNIKGGSVFKTEPPFLSFTRQNVSYRLNINPY